MTRLSEPDPDVTHLTTSSDAVPVEAEASHHVEDAAHGRQQTHRHDSGRPLTSSSGWLTSTDAIDHGRFQPGALLDGRYRVVGRIGRGGMGEVYRADDLKLGQPVALKFLPEDVDRDPGRLTQLHAEVRMARQVSHPNVCRVYDVDEFEGHTFLSMEYVDGEDLASLIRRIGRFPQDRAIELSRQLCAGLAAAHDRGVVHRDLKPANIMLDGGGRIRVTDFGLAGATGEALRAGTPAYMAPEQIAGREVTTRSDIYALGLVLYELFTGQRALEARNIAELIAKREQAAITPPTAIVRDLDPSIEGIIFRCLEADPGRRPSSALGVAAALPGGDPLAAALAAGETPSPEMVAAAGTTEAVPTRIVAGQVAWIAFALLAVVGMYQRVLMINRVNLSKPPAALQDRVEEIVGRLGYGEGVVSRATGIGLDFDWARHIAATRTDADRWSQLSAPRPLTATFWYRTSPRLMIPTGTENNISGLNPALNISGMTLAVVDPTGRLAEFHAVPEATQDDTPHGTTKWSDLFEAAGLPMESFKAATPRWVPVVYADERKAWDGVLPERPDVPVRVEAAAYNGKPVFFAVTGSWDRSSRAPRAAPSSFTVLIQTMAGFVMPGLMVLGGFLARRNLRLGRGDRRGAFRAALAILVLSLTGWVLTASHIPSFAPEVARLFDAISRALFQALVLWLTYLGLEPYVRRKSPDSLIGWTRLLAGQWRDTHVGGDLLIGISAGLAMTALMGLHNVLPPLVGQPPPMPLPTDMMAAMGLRYGLGMIVRNVGDATSAAMLGTIGLIAIGILLRRRWAAVLAALVVFTPVALNGMFILGTPLLDVVFAGLIILIFIGVIARFGLLAAAATLAVHFITQTAPLTLNLGAWWATTGICVVLLIVVATLVAAALALDRLQPRRSLAWR
jgi:Protein kinase domain